MDHIRSCLMRNGFPRIISDPNFEEELTDQRSPEEKLVLNAVLKNTHIVEQLMDDGLHSEHPWLLPDKVRKALDVIWPLYAFLHRDVTRQSMEDFAKAIPDLVIQEEDLFSRAMHWFLDRIQFTLWCLDQQFVGPGWSPKSILELCTEQPSELYSLKMLGGLQKVDEAKILDLFNQQPSTLDSFRGFLAVIKFISYLFKHLNVQPERAASCLEDVERLLIDIQSPEMSLSVLEDLFALCFLRREHVLFEETASDSADAGEEAPIASESVQSNISKKIGDACPSNSNNTSPNNSQTGTSSAAVLSKKDLSVGFLCQDPDKLQVSLQMLKRRLEALDSGATDVHDTELSLRRRNLDQHVSQGLWRLQLVVEGDWAVNYFSSRRVNSVSVRQSWIARLTAPVQQWYGGHQMHIGRRNNFKSRPPKPKKSSTSMVDPLLLNRLLAQPTSLMVMSMAKSRLSAARQVADLYHLWSTPEGRELRSSLSHASAVHDLVRRATELKKTHTDESSPSDVFDSVDQVHLSSTVETLLSTLQPEDGYPGSSVILLADLVCSSGIWQPEISVQLMKMALDRAEAATPKVDVNREPWRTLRRLSECSRDQLSDRSKWVSPLRSPLPLDVGKRRERIDRLERADRELCHLRTELNRDGSFETTIAAFENLNEVLEALRPLGQELERTSTPLLTMSRYLQHLRRLAPSRMQEYSAFRLLEQDVGTIIMERLQDEPNSMDEVAASAQLIGIELASFLAERLTCADQSMDLSDTDFIRRLLSYLHSRSPFLAQVVDLQLQTERGISFLTTDSSTLCERMDIFRRFLERPSRLKKDASESAPPPQTRSRRSRPASMIEAAPSPLVDLQNALPEDSESTNLCNLIKEAIPSTVLGQLEHLVTSPLLLIEQLLMNSQMGLATDVVRLLRLRTGREHSVDLNELLLRYAAKALALGLPDIPSSSSVARHKDPSKPSLKKAKKNGSFVLPAVAPSKDQWVADAEVSQCPCCQTVFFSMFDRRHHCRRCGRVVCAHCSPHRHLVDGYDDVPVRTCVDCHSFLQDRADLSSDVGPTTSSIKSIRSADKDGQILWRLSLEDAQHNHIARREFSYEHAPNLALALGMVHLCRGDSDLVANFLLDQSSSMLATLHRYLLHGTLLDVCSDPLMMFSLIKSLILSAKMRYSEIIAAPLSSAGGQSGAGTKSKPARGLARCDALLGQLDLLSLLSSANCLHLLPPQPLAQLDTWRKLRDRLIDVELWSLALDVSTKAGLDAGSVWAAWGLVCLKAGNFQGARQRFQRCLKPAKTSPLLQEILTVLENLDVPSSLSQGSSSTAKRSRRVSSSSTVSPQSSMMLNSDNPQLITALLGRLGDICNGRLTELDEKSCTLEEILFYLDTYGQPESPFAYLVERSCRIDMAVQRYAASRSHSNVEVFNQGLLLPCLRTSQLEDLVVEMKRHDSSFHSWKNHILAAAHLLESKSFWNCLYQLHCLTCDWIRASLVAIRRLFLSDLFGVETLVARSHLLEDIVTHLNQYLGRQPAQPLEGLESDKQFPLWWPTNEVVTLRKTVQLQLKVTGFLDNCLREGKLPASLLATVQSFTQSPDGIPSSASDIQLNSKAFFVPTLLGSRQYRCSSAVLVTCAGGDLASTAAFELSWRICSEMRVRLDRYFRLSAFVLIKQSQVPTLIQLVQFLKTRMTTTSVGFFEFDDLLVECATLTQDRDKESKSPDTELIVQLIRQPASKIRAFINLGWLKAAYLLAVKNGSVTDVISIQQEAVRLEQSAVLALCDKWLRVRNVAR